MSEMTNVVHKLGSAVQQWGELAKLSGISKALSETISKYFQDIRSPKKRAKNTNTGHYEY